MNCGCVCLRMVFLGIGRHGCVVIQRITRPWFPAPTRPTCQKGLCGSGCLRTNLAGHGGEEGRWTHLGGLGGLRANKGEPRADAAGHPSPSERSPWAFRASEEDARRGGLCTQGRSPRATWRRRWALLSRGGGRLQLAVGCPSAGCARGACRRRGRCLRGVFFSPAGSWRRLRCLKTVNYAAFVCRVGGWGQG